MELRLLLCVFGVVLGAPADSSNNVHYDTIVIGMGSAGTTAATELAKAGKRVLALEAQARIGGRVHTVKFGDGVVEVGAEWVHGNVSSRTYELATQHEMALKNQVQNLKAYRSDGTTNHSGLVSELYETDFVKNSPPPESAEPYGTYYTQKLREYLATNKPDVLKDEDFVNEYLQWVNLATNVYEGSSDWNDVATNDRYDELGGPQTISWHRHGYKTFFELMMNVYECQPTTPKIDVKLSTEVTHITAPQNPNEKVVVTCKDGSTYEAETAIVTVSLGVLKAKHSTLFSPALPKDKQTAIEKITMGIVDKVIFSFKEAWWPKNGTMFVFLWKGEDRKKVPAEDFWTTRVLGAHRPMGSSNTLTMWINGDVAEQVENLSEDVVKTKCLELLQRFVGNAIGITVPQPTGIIRSTWLTNPFTRGSYSFDSRLAYQYPDARSWLGSPLVDSSDAPRVLFAGEATNLNHFSTVHGASETGHREAQRLLNTA